MTPTRESSLPGGRLSAAAVLVCLGGSANFAYHLIITNPAQDAFLHFVNNSFQRQHGTELNKEQLDTLWSLIVSILYWGTIVGAFLIQFFSEKFGRKHGLTVANSIQVAAAVLAVYSYFNYDYIAYTASRFILGIGQAISLGIGPMYIMECSPSRCRGIISLSTALIMQVFVVIAAIIAMPNIWGTVDSWWKLYAVEIVELCLVIALSLFLPESPVALQASGKSASESIQFYHGLEKDEADKLLQSEGSDSKEEEKVMGLMEVWKDSASRKGTFLGCTIMFAMTFSGLVAVNAFAVEILMSTGLDILLASYANVGICCMSVLGVLVSSTVVEKYGRRPLCIIGIVTLAFVNIVIFGLMFGFEKTKIASLGWSLVVMCCVFIFVACITIVPVGFFITSELVNSAARPAALTWVNLVLSAGRSILLAIFLPLKLFLGSGISYFVLFFPPLVFSGIYVYYNLPETKGKTIDEVYESYENNTPRRRSFRYWKLVDRKPKSKPEN